MSDTPRYLFRYRNLLTNDTLGEHRAIITREGSCWWGWWQRPAEDTRRDFWLDLMRQAQEGPVAIGLFDSDPDTGGSVHLARLVEVIPPGEQGRAPSVPEPKQHLVPSYYRETPFSSAWMRLDEISDEPLATSDFYRHHAFRRPPQLAHIDPAQRERFLDKLVLDADELRSMDTTIWELREAGTGDRDERILTASSRVTQALSSQPILLRSGRILHLSDLHFTSSAGQRAEHRWQLINEGSPTLHERIVHALRQELGPEPNIGLILISGDLTYRASPDEFYEAFRFVHALLGALKLGPDQLVLVPGNHDIAWTRQDARWDPAQPVNEAPPAAMQEYRLFYERIYRHPAAVHLGMARRFVCPSGVCLEIGALNTSALEQGRGWLAGMGRLADGAFAALTSTLGWSEAATSSLRMLVLHHHVTATEDVLPSSEFSRGFGMAADAKQTLRQAARHGVSLILHGHRHQPFLGAEQVYAELEHRSSSWSLGRVGIVGSGSAGSTSVSNDDNYFNLFDIHPDRLELTMFRARSPEQTRGEFQPMGHWKADSTPARGRLVLGDWEHVESPGARSS